MRLNWIRAWCLLACIGCSQVLCGQVRDTQPRELAGLSASEAFEFKDGLELDPTAEIVERLLYRLKKSSPATRFRFSQYAEELSWEQLWTDTIDYRFWLVERSATLKRLERLPIPAVPSEAEIKSVYLGHATVVDQQGQTRWLTIISRNAPKELPLGEGLNEPIRFAGLLYCTTKRDLSKVAEDGFAYPEASLAFICDSIQWYPEQDRNAPRSHVALAQLGFDVGLFDIVESQNARGLTEADSEAFFQLIAAVQRAAADGGIARLPVPRTALPDVIQKPRDHLGAIVQFSAPCRECTLTKVPYPEIQSRLGVKQYYQLALFPDVGKVKYTEKGNSVTFDRYPVIVCCTELPAGETPETMAGKQLSIDGVFYRTWRFESEFSDQTGIAGTNSPLIMSNAPVVLKPSTAALNRYVLVFVLSVIGVIGLLMVYLRVVDRREKTHTQTLLEELPDRIDTDGLD